MLMVDVLKNLNVYPLSLKRTKIQNTYMKFVVYNLAMVGKPTWFDKQFKPFFPLEF